jgi:hypothetical protein
LNKDVIASPRQETLDAGEGTHEKKRGWPTLNPKENTSWASSMTSSIGLGLREGWVRFLSCESCSEQGRLEITLFEGNTFAGFLHALGSIAAQIPPWFWGQQRSPLGKEAERWREHRSLYSPGKNRLCLPGPTANNTSIYQWTSTNPFHIELFTPHVQIFQCLDLNYRSKEINSAKIINK